LQLCLPHIFGSYISQYIYRSMSSNQKLTFNFSKLKAGLIIFLCLLHFSPSSLTRPGASNLNCGFKLIFSKSVGLFNTSLISSGSVRVTLGTGPNQIKEFLPTYHQQTIWIQLTWIWKGRKKKSRIEKNRQICVCYLTLIYIYTYVCFLILDKSC